MNNINEYVLDCRSMTDVESFYDGLFQILGSPPWHGKNINALADSIIYGGINDLEPPFIIKITNIPKANHNLYSEIEYISNIINSFYDGDINNTRELRIVG